MLPLPPLSSLRGLSIRLIPILIVGLALIFQANWPALSADRTLPGADSTVYLPLILGGGGSSPEFTATPTPTGTGTTSAPTGTATSTGIHTSTPTGTDPAPTGTATEIAIHTPTPTLTPPTPLTATPTRTGTITITPTGDAIIVTHLHTDIHQIPSYWIGQAKQFVVHYAHTSHGSQVLSGLEWLEQQDAQYNVDIEVSGTVILPDDPTALRIYDGNNYPGDTYIVPEMYWETTDGISHTRSVADTGWFDFSLWTWCGQMSYYSDEQIQDYIDVMAQFETEYPAMRFIYYTGHTDGTGPGGDLWRHNDMVRDYVQANGKVLFDFADIETYAPDGSGPYYNDGDGYCEWCDAWCTAHPTAFECQDLPGCSHTHGLACTLKGQAFWWLMARLAGWDGNPTAP